MDIKKEFVKVFSFVISVMLIVQLSGCGYFLYPERRGQKSGRIDPEVAILDGLGLLLFIIPGVIAFAVDFTNGTIYLPSGSRRSSMSTGAGNTVVIRVNPAELNEKMIEEIVRKQAGCSIRFDIRNVEIYQLDEPENIEARLAELGKSGYWQDKRTEKGTRPTVPFSHG